MLTTGRPLTRTRTACRTMPAHKHVRSLLAAPTSSLPHLPPCAPLSCETFRREPATRRFVWSFAPMPMSYHRVEHQNGSDPPPVFLRASVSTGIVHRLSGPTTPTNRSPTAPAIHIRLAAAVVSLVRVSIRVRVLGLRPCIFTFHLPDGVFSQFPRGTCSLSASPPYLALDASTTHSRCTTKQHYSSLAHPLRGSHPLRPRIPSGLVLRATTPEGFPPGLLLVHSPLLQKSTFVSSPVLNDMLKSGTSPYASRTIRTAADTGRFSHAVAFVIAGRAYRSHTGDSSFVVVTCRASTGRQVSHAHNTYPTAAFPSVPCEKFRNRGNGGVKNSGAGKNGRAQGPVD